MIPDEIRSAEIAAALRQGKLISEADWIITGAVRQLIEAMAGDAAQPLSAEQAVAAAAALNAHRRHQLTYRLAKAWRDAGHFDLGLAKHQMQALIDSGALDDADEQIAGLLQRAARQKPADADQQQRLDAEALELRGLSARVAKDRFVRLRLIGGNYDDASDEALLQALRGYDEQYQASRSRYWHGINALALEARRARELGTPPAADFRARVLELIAFLRERHDTHIARRAELDCARASSDDTTWQHDNARWSSDDANTPWLLASLSEAHLALGNACDEADRWLQMALEHPLTRPFNVASYARQLREIWQGDALRPDESCAGRLAKRLLDHEHCHQHTVTVSAQQLEALRDTDTVHEKRFSDATGLDFPRIAEACDSIGVVCKLSGERIGSGFLIDQRHFWPELPELLVFVTNAHVISPTYAEAQLHPREAWVSFNTETIVTRKPIPPHKVGRVLFTSEPGPFAKPIAHCEQLDITIVTLETLPRRALGLDPSPQLALPARNQPAFVIGHPGGRDITVSVEDSKLLDSDRLPRLFHYRTPTEGGSSGSPVFNKDWKVVGVHHAGRENAPMLSDPTQRHHANEGIALWALCRKLASVPAPSVTTTALGNSSDPTVP